MLHTPPPPLLLLLVRVGNLSCTKTTITFSLPPSAPHHSSLSLTLFSEFYGLAGNQLGFVTLSLSAGQQVPLLLLLRQGSQTRLKRPRENAAT